MRRLCAISAVFLLCAGIFLGGCTPQAPKNDDNKKQVAIDPNKVKVDPPIVKAEQEKKNDVPPNKGNVPVGADKQDQYEAALGDALSALAERKWTDALEAFEAARSFQDTEFVQSEIAKLKQRIDQDGIAKDALKNIEAVLNDGNADDAIKLADDALKEFGAGDDAARLIQLRLQAEAIRNAEKKEGNDVRFARFKKEGDLAVQEKNLRAAALAYEQAIEARADADLQKTYEDIRAKLDDYDALRKKGTELRRDPLQLDDALAAFKAAAVAWDTLQIRADIDDCRLAFVKRRDVVAVADFELRNDVGMPGAGAALAEELLPRLKPKFDLVERAQLRQVLGELKVQQGFLDDPKQQQQIGKLAKSRYLVVGSVQRIVGVSVRARLVDVQTGLVVQTGKIVAANMEEALNLAPNLAEQLMMTDEAKRQFEQEVREKAAKPAAKAPDDAVIPPAPLPAAAAPPPPLVNPAPPVFVNAKANALQNFAPPPQVFVAPQVDPLQLQMRNRLLFATIEMGDFLFRSGRFGEAQRHYQFALMLAPDNVAIQLRFARTQPFVPPLSVIVFAKPRIAVLPFMTLGNPFVVPPSLGYWTPTNLAPYFSWRYEVVDPAEVYWYMGRMGLTMNDLIADPNARRWLGRAVGVRYFVLGSLTQTASFDVNTYLLDAEFGYLQGSARIHVRDPYELKLRLPELAQLTLMTPAEQAAYQQARLVQLIADGQRHLNEGRFQQAVGAFEAVLEVYPYNIQVQFLREQARAQARFQDFERERRGQFEAQQAALAAQRQRQRELSQASEAARRRASAAAAARSEAQRGVHLRFRFDAQASLVARAEVALKTKNFGLSIGLFQGAIGLTPPPSADVPAPVQAVNYQSFAQARLGAESAEQLRAAQFSAVREATLRQERDKQLAAAQKQLVAERASAQARLDAERATQAQRDEEAYQASINQGMKYMAASKYEPALVAFQAAQRLAHTTKQTEKVNNLIDVIVQRQAEALAKTPDAKAAVEARLALERKSKKAAEAQAKQNEEKYQQALQLAQTALAAKNYDTAQAKFQEAGQVYKTDAVLNGLQQVDKGRAALGAESKRAEAEKAKADAVKQLVTTGNAALTSKDYAAALQAFQQAKKLAPSNLDVLAGLTQAELAIQRLNRDTEQAQRTQAFQRLLKNGQANLANKQYDAAVANLTEATKLNPTDATAQAALKKALQARDASLTDVKGQAAAKLKTATYQKLLADGRRALDGRRYAEAIKAFSDAQTIFPGDQTAKDYLQEAQSARKAAEAAAAASKAKQQELITTGLSALKAKNYDAAEKALRSARLVDPTNPAIVQGLKDIEAGRKALGDDKQRLADYQLALNAGQKSMLGRDYKAAIKSFEQALKAIPNDAKATQQLQQAQQALADAAAAQAQRLASYQKAMTAGQTALLNKKYSEAVKSFSDALKSMPGDQKATQQLAQAQQALRDSMKVKTPPDPPKQDFDSVIQRGAAAEKELRYGDALKAYQEALKIRPKDQPTLSKAQFAQNVVNGEQALNNKMWMDAVRELENALRNQPKNAYALKLLQKAKNKGK